MKKLISKNKLKECVFQKKYLSDTKLMFKFESKSNEGNSAANISRSQYKKTKVLF